MDGGSVAGWEEWSVVVLDVEGSAQETVTGFSSLESADGYVRLTPEIQRWTSVPSRQAIPDQASGV
ncbi:hypothetical protein [Parafrankia sp. FMc2]|uniref:hypothetical protein n=1 Tax=Parafrankia sp. FMc2 TaxID=3233196 RepID=UPI0034D5DE48